MVCAFFGSSMFVYCSRVRSDFHTLTLPEILPRRLFLTMKTRIVFSPDASFFGNRRGPRSAGPSDFLIYVQKL